MADAAGPDSTWQKWHNELELARKQRGYETWLTRSRKIIRRYRDERSGTDGASDGMTPEGEYGSKFNILWSNVQTLLPALFAKSPKPVVERRYLDRDDVGRTASVILERALLYELDNGNYQQAVRKAVLDRLLPGRGVVWLRYQPTFSALPQKTQTDPDDEAQEVQPGDEEAEEDGEEPGTPEEEVAYECTPVDYINWADFGTSPSRTWEEVWYIWKRVYMTREEMKSRGFKSWEDVPLDWSPNQEQKTATGANAITGSNEGQKRAKILEIWDKSKRKVYWMAEGWSDEMLDEQDDPLGLEGFYPVPKPLFATLTNESLVPVPDFHEYQDQAIELDDLTSRIFQVTKAIKVAGVYDASIPELQRMFEEGFENRLVPADNMAEFMQKAGSNGMGHLWLLPIKDQAEVLMQLYQARDQVKQSLYEITGISDIVRGQATQGAKTATEQRIKGQFASMRLNDMQGEVARFCRDVLRIMGELIAEHYDPMTLYLISGYEQYAKDQWPPETFAQQQPPQMGHNGGPPMQGAPQGMPPQAMGMPMQPMLSPEQQAQAKAADMFKRAVELLRNDKLRGFRIDIETDSLIEPDQQQMQQARTELLGALSQFLPQAIQAGAAMPELKPLMARLLMFFLRGFKASRDIESAFEQFIDDLTKEAANPQPKPPSPEQIKAQAEQQKSQMEMQRLQAKAQIDQQKGQQDLEIAQAKNQMDLQKMQADLEIKKQELLLDQQRLAMEERKMQMEMAAKERAAAIDTALSERQASLDSEGMERKHEIGLEVMAAKAEQAKANGAAREA